MAAGILSGRTGSEVGGEGGLRQPPSRHRLARTPKAGTACQQTLGKLN